METTVRNSIDSFISKLNINGSPVPESKRIWGMQNDHEIHCECVKCTISDCTRCQCCDKCDCCFLPPSRKNEN